MEQLIDEAVKDDASGQTAIFLIINGHAPSCPNFVHYTCRACALLSDMRDIARHDFFPAPKCKG